MSKDYNLKISTEKKYIYIYIYMAFKGKHLVRPKLEIDTFYIRTNETV